MQVDFLTSLISVATMIALAIPGFILRKKNMLPEKAVAALVAVLIYVSQPFLTIDSFLEKDYRPELLVGMGVTFLLSLLLHAATYFLSKGTFALFRAKKAGDGEEKLPLEAKLTAEKRICTITAFMGNVGFMGIPVMKALFPENPEMLIYTAVFILGFNIASWTLGVYEVTGDRKNISLRRALLNPPTAALVVALPLFFFKSYIPVDVIVPVSSAVGYLADMTLPLSMIILDDLERLVEYVRLGPRFSNSVLQALLVLIKKNPPTVGRKLMIVATTSQRNAMEELGLMDPFNVIMDIPVPYAPKDVAEVLRKTGGMDEEVIAKVSSEITMGVPVKELLLIQEMARSDSENGVITYEKYMDCFRAVHPDM